MLLKALKNLQYFIEEIRKGARKRKKLVNPNSPNSNP
ncbi:hypothetical protein BVRB_2g023400 [Beta vulgaris subsp. vulgaris]|nr:hypothetical protein BVRB_2g023400 [Beta vulgaris subsp. vulgaris]